MWRLFRLACVQRLIVACVAMILTLTAPTPSPALIMVGRGNDPVRDAGWPTGGAGRVRLTRCAHGLVRVSPGGESTLGWRADTTASRVRG